MIEIKSGRKVRRYSLTGPAPHRDAFKKQTAFVQKHIQKALGEKNATTAKVLERVAEGMLFDLAKDLGIECRRVKGRKA